MNRSEWRTSLNLLLHALLQIFFSGKIKSSKKASLTNMVSMLVTRRCRFVQIYSCDNVSWFKDKPFCMCFCPYKYGKDLQHRGQHLIQVPWPCKSRSESCELFPFIVYSDHISKGVFLVNFIR